MDTIDRINELMQQRGMNAATLARATGLSTGLLSQWNKRLQQPSSKKLKVIADYFGVSVDYLLGQEKVIIPGRLTIKEQNDPESKEVIFHIEAADEEAFDVGMELVNNLKGNPILDYTPAGRVMVAMAKLNDKGKATAVERVEELTKISDYTIQSTSQPPVAAPVSPPSTPKGTDTTTDKKPPTDAPAPADDNMEGGEHHAE